MGEDLLLHLLAAGDELRIVLQPLRENRHALLQVLAELVVRAVADLDQEPVQPVEELREDPVVDGLRDPPRRLAPEPRPQRLAMLVEKALRPAHGRVDQLDVPALGGRDRERPAGERRERHASHPRQHRRLERPLDRLVAQHARRARQYRRRVAGDRRGVLLHAHPRGGAARHADRAQPLEHHAAGQEVLLDEPADRTPELILAGGDERGVGDRDAERVPEQRRHREPVRETTDHRPLRGGLDVADPAPPVRKQAGRDEDRGGEHQQPGGPDLHPSQRTPARLLVATFRLVQGQLHGPILPPPHPVGCERLRDIRKMTGRFRTRERR